MKEEWRDIEGYKGLYQVSDLGRVKSLKRKNVPKELIRVQHMNIANGYVCVTLSKEGKKKNHTTHILVAVAFLNHIIGDYDKIVDHKDENKENNACYNLRIITTRNNTTRKQRGKSNYVGVSWNINSCKWKAGIVIKKKHNHLGYFNDEIEASDMYQLALKNLDAYKNQKQFRELLKQKMTT